MPNILILGPLHFPRIPNLSFLVKSPIVEFKFYHFNFITALLNDIFGIKCHGEYMNSSTYEKELLSIINCNYKEFGKMARNSTYAKLNNGPFLLFHPGFTRISFKYLMDYKEIEFILQALEWVIANAHKMLNKYEYCIRKGSWKAFGTIKRTNSIITDSSSRFVNVPTKRDIFDIAESIASESKRSFNDDEFKRSIKKNKKFEKLRWFVTEEDLEEY